MANDLRGRMKDLLSITKKAGRDLGDGIEDLRQHLRMLRDERKRLMVIPVSKEIALDRAQKWARAKTQMDVDGSLFIRAAEGWRMPEMTVEVAIAAFAGDILVDGARRAVELQYEAGVEWISEEDRELRRIEIDRKILDAELSEESIIRTAEIAGFPVTRRADADPRAVLAHDKVLP